MVIASQAILPSSFNRHMNGMNGGMGMGMIIGIVVGLLVALALLIFPAMMLRRGTSAMLLLLVDLPLFLAATVSVLTAWPHDIGPGISECG